MSKLKGTDRKTKHNRVRKKITGTSERPRLCVFKSGKHFYAQVVDDTKSVTLVSAGTVEKIINENLDKTCTVSAATEVGKTIAKRALDAGINQIVFDRGGYVYHGKVAAAAEAAREAGLKF